MEVEKIETRKPGRLEKPLYRVTICWAHKDREVIENISYVTYQGRGYSLGFDSKPTFMELRGLTGTPVDIIKLDDRIDRVKIEATSQSVLT